MIDADDHFQLIKTKKLNKNNRTSLDSSSLYQSHQDNKGRSSKYNFD